jgi:NADH dehydrogenase
VRRLPAVPVIGGGDQPFEPIWHEDAGEALARIVEREDLGGRTLELAGGDRTSMDDLLDRLGTITGREPARIPLPAPLARVGATLASMLGLDLPVTASQVTMLEEGNIVRAPEGNALESILGLTPTPLDEGLRMLADAQPEQLPDEGVGPLRRKRFYAHITGAQLPAAQLCAQFRDRFAEILPLEVGAEPGANTVIREGATITMKMPLRGVIQVRCEETSDSCVTLATLKGHPLAGMVRFFFEPRGAGEIDTEIRVYARAGGLLDHIALSTIGTAFQNEAWHTTLERIIELSGGEAPEGIHHESSKLDDGEDEIVQEWMESVVQERRRKEGG